MQQRIERPQISLKRVGTPEPPRTNGSSTIPVTTVRMGCDGNCAGCAAKCGERGKPSMLNPFLTPFSDLTPNTTSDIINPATTPAVKPVIMMTRITEPLSKKEPMKTEQEPLRQSSSPESFSKPPVLSYSNRQHLGFPDTSSRIHTAPTQTPNEMTTIKKPETPLPTQTPRVDQKPYSHVVSESTQPVAEYTSPIRQPEITQPQPSLSFDQPPKNIPDVKLAREIRQATEPERLSAPIIELQIPVEEVKPPVAETVSSIRQPDTTPKPHLAAVANQRPNLAPVMTSTTETPTIANVTLENATPSEPQTHNPTATTSQPHAVLETPTITAKQTDAVRPPFVGKIPPPRMNEYQTKQPASEQSSEIRSEKPTHVPVEHLTILSIKTSEASVPENTRETIRLDTPAVATTPELPINKPEPVKVTDVNQRMEYPIQEPAIDVKSSTVNNRRLHVSSLPEPAPAPQPSITTTVTREQTTTKPNTTQHEPPSVHDAAAKKEIPVTVSPVDVTMHVAATIDAPSVQKFVTAKQEEARGVQTKVRAIETQQVEVEALQQNHEQYLQPINAVTEVSPVDEPIAQPVQTPKTHYIAPLPQQIPDQTPIQQEPSNKPQVLKSEYIAIVDEQPGVTFDNSIASNLSLELPTQSTPQPIEHIIQSPPTIDTTYIHESFPVIVPRPNEPVLIEQISQHISANLSEDHKEIPMHFTLPIPRTSEQQRLPRELNPRLLRPVEKLIPALRKDRLVFPVTRRDVLKPIVLSDDIFSLATRETSEKKPPVKREKSKHRKVKAREPMKSVNTVQKRIVQAEKPFHVAVDSKSNSVKPERKKGLRLKRKKAIEKPQKSESILFQQKIPQETVVSTPTLITNTPKKEEPVTQEEKHVESIVEHLQPKEQTEVLVIENTNSMFLCKQTKREADDPERQLIPEMLPIDSISILQAAVQHILVTEEKTETPHTHSTHETVESLQKPKSISIGATDDLIDFVEIISSMYDSRSEQDALGENVAIDNPETKQTLIPTEPGSIKSEHTVRFIGTQKTISIDRDMLYFLNQELHALEDQMNTLQLLAHTAPLLYTPSEKRYIKAEYLTPQDVSSPMQKQQMQNAILNWYASIVWKLMEHNESNFLFFPDIPYQYAA